MVIGPDTRQKAKAESAVHKGEQERGAMRNGAPTPDSSESERHYGDFEWNGWGGME